MWFNRSFSLAYTDGPYGMLLPSAFFERNPGLGLEKRINVGFQPEIGSVSAPTYRGLLRFMSADEVESGFPRRNNSLACGKAWDYHKFLPWTSTLSNNKKYDHVYAYFAKNERVNASDWAAAAQLASHAQYQNLFNGFISHAFDYTTAVVMWKSQSPWPSLRGFLYDWYLETTGTLRGVRAALGASVSVVFNPLLWKLHVVNRQVYPLFQNASAHSVGAKYTWIDLHGHAVATEEVLLIQNMVPAMSSLQLGLSSDHLKWPSGCTDVCLLRVQLIDDVSNADQQFTWHWLTDPALGEASDFSLLGEFRKRQEAKVELKLGECIVSEGGGLNLSISLNVPASSLVVLFYPTLSLYRRGENLPLLPIFDNKETDIVVLPGSIQTRTIIFPATIQPGEVVRVVLSSWNAADIQRDVVCSSLEQLATKVLL